ncbi:choice-of-anchor D domain-containing protein [Mariniflexile soesokkakense]|uniref:Choice-of-anchor D domain-containing protein n=1 Tax=Mariniflexile soesokkakense TaxID=1343160 RepID=A0ABV0AEU5_9FLAO
MRNFITLEKFLFTCAIIFICYNGYSQSQTFTSSGSFAVPAGVTQVTVQAWGAGGGGSRVTTSGRRGGGGGGGAYASSVVTVIPSTSYTVTVGAGGIPTTTVATPGGASSFNTTSVVAAGGAGGVFNNTGAGAGGTTGASTGTTKYAGGAGAAGGGTFSGGGGGGAGSTGAGNNAVTSTGGAARTINGGAGGNGVSGSSAGTIGNNYGAGGSGAVTNSATTQNGGNGANGLVIVSWTPEINIQGNSVSIVDGDITPSATDHTEFGNIAVGASFDRTYTIQNLGTGTLNLTGTPRVAITGNAAFSILTQPSAASIAPNGSLTFVVRFTPTVVGVNLQADISISNNDGDENPSDFRIQGTATAPEINIRGNGTNIVDGDTTPSTTDHTEFGNVAVGATFDRTYTIQNLGTGTLNLSGTPRVAISGNPAFSILTQPSAASIASGGGDLTFVVRFEPTIASNNLQATISITNNDSDENPYDFQIQGSAISNIINFGPGGLWKYLDDGSDQGTAWYGTGFNDVSWASGNAHLGYGEGDEATTVGFGPDSNNKYPTTYFRKTFYVSPGDASYTNMDLDLTFDDGAVVYLNGVEIWAVNMPAGRTYTTYASGSSANNDTASISLANALVAGNNVIAVEIHQSSATSSDISFDLDLGVSNVASNLIPASGVWSYLDNGTNQGTAWYGTGFNYSGWATNNAEFGYGDGDETTVVSYGPSSSNKYVTTYFRRSFVITAADIASSKNTLLLNAIRDDGMVVYINGAEVWRDNMPTGAIAFNTLAPSAIGGSDETSWITKSIANPFTLPGTYEIGVEIHQNSITSSDLGFNFSMQAANQLLPRGGVWSYLDDGSNQGTAWRTAAVGSWATGNAQLGFGDGDETTVVANNNQITTYFRKTITASGSDVTNSTLKISTIRDDGIVIFINGVEILRNNMPVGTINYNTLAFDDVTRPTNNFEDFWNVFKVDNPLVSGINEIAVEIHQFNSTSDDISFDLELETNNDFVIVPSVKPDKDNDGREDYVDADDDNDGISDLVEGCYTTKTETLYPGSETSIKNSMPITTVLDDGNDITYSVNSPSNFGDITSYNAGEHGFGLRLKGAATNGQLTLDFTNPVKNLFFKLIDFDEGENIKVDVYDEFNNIVNLTSQPGIYHLGTYIEYTGNNTINELYNTTAPNTNNPENRADDIYGGAYFYFPNINVSKVIFTVNYTGSGTIRLVGVQYCSRDTDGDGVDDFHDLDSDNDGIPDLVEVGGTDIDGNGVVDVFTDVDGDGITAIYDSNDNSYFIEELGTLTNLDFDGDGVRNNIDLDSDNDGIPDILEAGGLDVDGDGKIDGFTDSNTDGYHDPYFGASALIITGPDTDGDGKPNSYPNKNADNTGLPNFLDIDSDDDGITDLTEAQATAAPFINYSSIDTDGDGISEVYDNIIGFGGRGLVPVDTDGDGIPDYLDTDSDNHGEPDIIEGHDINGDGTVNSSDWGTCLNSITSKFGTLANVDADGDGLDDGFDNDLVTYNSSNTGLSPLAHPNIDDIATLERDWREPDQEYNVIDFDGFNDYIDFSDKHNLTSSFTIEAWVKQDPTSTGNGSIVGKRDCNKGTNLGYQFSLIANKPNIKWYNNAGSLVLDLTSTFTIGTDKWYYISATYDNTTTTAKIYIDGIEVASNTSVSAPPVANNESFLIGAKFDDTNLSQKLSDEFKGWIDEVRIWGKALNATQIRAMLNQEIEQNGTAVRGKIVPLDIAGLLWTDLLGYYPMNSIVAGYLNDSSSYSKNGRIRNILSNEPQTAPLPYTTKANGAWTDNTASTPWTNGNSVWDVPNSIGIDGTTPVDWNIVRTSHNITSGDKNITVLGLITNTPSTKLSIADPADSQDETNSGQSLRVTSYLKLIGDIDLVGESQLLQDQGSVLDVTSSGRLERDQQGNKDLYTYNYWCSPVGASNTTSNNNSYKMTNNVLRNGSISSTPNNITFLTSGYNGSASGTNISIADYWIWKYANNLSNNYSVWQHVRRTGTILAGEGFTMKGVESSGTSFTSTQNYNFYGKPNNGDITLTLSAGNDYLVGNPYPSALDADEFILDNTSSSGGRAASDIINGTLYFWDHFANSTHTLKAYEGGYATYTRLGALPAISTDTRINNSGAPGTKVPERYIPVSQGFFVVAGTGGTITFKNSQRVFKTESSDPSMFFKSTNPKGKLIQSSADIRQKIKLQFDSPSGYHRLILAGVDKNTSNAFDVGYDAPLIENNAEDMYWISDTNDNYIIQAVNNFNETQTLPLGVKINKQGVASIKIDALANIDKNTIIYLHDKQLNVYHNLKEGKYDVYLTVGKHLNRFEVTFANEQALNTNSVETNAFQVYFSNEDKTIVIHNPTGKNIESTEIFNVLGKSVYKFESRSTENIITHKPNHLSTGTYIIKLKTDTRVVSKKVLIN